VLKKLLADPNNKNILDAYVKEHDLRVKFALNLLLKAILTPVLLFFVGLLVLYPSLFSVARRDITDLFKNFIQRDIASESMRFLSATYAYAYALMAVRWTYKLIIALFNSMVDFIFKTMHAIHYIREFPMKQFIAGLLLFGMSGFDSHALANGVLQAENWDFISRLFNLADHQLESIAAYTVRYIGNFSLVSFEGMPLLSTFISWLSENFTAFTAWFMAKIMLRPNDAVLSNAVALEEDREESSYKSELITLLQNIQSPTTSGESARTALKSRRHLIKKDYQQMVKECPTSNNAENSSQAQILHAIEPLITYLTQSGNHSERNLKLAAKTIQALLSESNVYKAISTLRMTTTQASIVEKDANGNEQEEAVSAERIQTLFFGQGYSLEHLPLLKALEQAQPDEQAQVKYSKLFPCFSTLGKKSEKVINKLELDHSLQEASVRSLPHPSTV
jgi:hypothetical protein